MKRIISTLFGLAVLCLFAEAQAVPATVSFTGRLTTSNGPVTGNVNVVFSLFNQATNGTVMWTETRSNLLATNGLVYADLGALTTLDESVLLNAPLFLEISVGGEILTPRLPLQSVPYSIRSEVANSADTLGTIAPGDVVTAVNASGGISANRSGNTVTLTGTAVAGTAPIAVAAGNVSLVTCAANQIYKMNAGGTAWACGADNNTAPTASAPLSVTGVNVSLVNCAANQVYKMNAGGTAWACAADSADVPPTASAPLSVTGVNVSLVNCAANQIYKMNAGGTAWACSADPTPVAGTGITVTGSTVAVNTTTIQARVTGTCPAGQSISSISSTGTVTCEPDNAFTSCTWEQETTTIATTTQDATCPAGKAAISGGCDPTGTASVTFTRPFGPPADGAAITGTTAWNCQFSVGAIGHKAFALCCIVN
jgi:hypothetical protein